MRPCLRCVQKKSHKVQKSMRLLVRALKNIKKNYVPMFEVRTQKKIINKVHKSMRLLVRALKNIKKNYAPMFEVHTQNHIDVPVGT